jgi:hypothetical protein
MKRADLLERLRSIADSFIVDEEGHIEADRALLDFIDDDEVTEAFAAIPKWYS